MGTDVDALSEKHYLDPMSIKPLVLLPDPVLRQVSKPVERCLLYTLTLPTKLEV